MSKRKEKKTIILKEVQGKPGWHVLFSLSVPGFATTKKHYIQNVELFSTFSLKGWKYSLVLKRKKTNLLQTQILLSFLQWTAIRFGSSVFHRTITMKLLTLSALLFAMMALITAACKYCSIIYIVYLCV